MDLSMMKPQTDQFLPYSGKFHPLLNLLNCIKISYAKLKIRIIKVLLSLIIYTRFFGYFCFLYLCFLLRLKY